MPGGIAHMALLVELSNRSGRESEETAVNIIRSCLNSAIAGVVAPDFAYAPQNDPIALRWADLAHYHLTGKKIVAFADTVRSLLGDERLTHYAWLLGYAAHAAMDVSVHPVVNLNVGPYQTNREEHRRMETSHDVWLLQQPVGESVVRLAHIAARVPMDDTIVLSWCNSLQKIHPEDFVSAPPDIKAWESSYWSRLLNASDRIDPAFIENIRTPHGRKSYRQVFVKGIDDVVSFLRLVTALVENNDEEHRALIENWDLDSGGGEGEPVDSGTGNAIDLEYWS